MARVGVLALQGDFAAHALALDELGADVREVRQIRDLDELDGLVLPGGESTAVLRLMGEDPWFARLRLLHDEGGVLFGTCAGAILLSREVRGPSQPSIGLLDAAIERNAYGRQVDSFEVALDVPALGGPIQAVFIRAPRFRALAPAVRVLASCDGDPVLVRQDRVLAATFHPELTRDRLLHRYFLEVIDSGSRQSGSGRTVARALRGRRPSRRRTS
jgi:5'-phosphate synthase pdxT subunit